MGKRGQVLLKRRSRVEGSRVLLTDSGNNTDLVVKGQGEGWILIRLKKTFPMSHFTKSETSGVFQLKTAYRIKKKIWVTFTFLVRMNRVPVYVSPVLGLNQTP